MEANRKNINAAFAKMQQEAKQLGVELLTKPEVFIDDDHLCCVWYGGYICLLYTSPSPRDRG